MSSGELTGTDSSGDSVRSITLSADAAIGSSAMSCGPERTRRRVSTLPGANTAAPAASRRITANELTRTSDVTPVVPGFVRRAVMMPASSWLGPTWAAPAVTAATSSSVA